MQTKTFEIRDSATFIPALAIKLDPVTEADRYLLSRAGYGQSPADQRRYVMLGKIDGGERCRFECVPENWNDRTWQVAHGDIVRNWDSYESGAVIDCEYILGETTTKKESEANALED